MGGYILQYLMQCPRIIHSNRCKQEDSCLSGDRPSPHSLTSGSPNSAHGPPTPPTTPNGGGDKRAAPSSVQHHLSPSGKWCAPPSICRLIVCRRLWRFRPQGPLKSRLTTYQSTPRHIPKDFQSQITFLQVYFGTTSRSLLHGFLGPHRWDR